MKFTALSIRNKQRLREFTGRLDDEAKAVYAESKKYIQWYMRQSGNAKLNRHLSILLESEKPLRKRFYYNPKGLMFTLGTTLVKHAHNLSRKLQKGD